jgi:D-arabinonate dehydratase
MAIESIEIKSIRIPLSTVFDGSYYSVKDRCAVIAKTHADNGLVSEFYLGDDRSHGLKIKKIIENDMANKVLGRKLTEHQQMFDELFMNFPVKLSGQQMTQRRIYIHAVAMVDIALWDLRARAANQSLSEFLGQKRDRVRTTSTGGYYGENPRDFSVIEKEYSQLDAQGIKGWKFKVGKLPPEHDAERVRFAHSLIPDDFLLCVDANCGWTVEDAKHFADLIEDLNIDFFEEPCHWYDDISMMAELRKQISIPINAGQSELTSHGIRRMVEADAVDIMNFDCFNGPGVTDWLQASAYAEKKGVKAGHHEEPQIALHLLSSQKHAVYAEIFGNENRDPLWANAWANRPKMVDGCLKVPEGPGLNIEINWDYLNKYVE